MTLKSVHHYSFEIDFDGVDVIGVAKAGEDARVEPIFLVNEVDLIHE